MRIISFARTTAALIACRKTVTRRMWSAKHHDSFVKALEQAKSAGNPGIIVAEIVRRVNGYDALEEEVKRLRETLRTVRRTITDGGDGAIVDTVWVGPGETLCDLIDNVLGEEWEATNV